MYRVIRVDDQGERVVKEYKREIYATRLLSEKHEGDGGQWYIEHNGKRFSLLNWLSGRRDPRHAEKSAIEVLRDSADRAVTFANRARNVLADQLSTATLDVISEGGWHDPEIAIPLCFGHEPLPEKSEATERFNWLMDLEQAAIELQLFVAQVSEYTRRGRAR